jgi:hypothetical protein
MSHTYSKLFSQIVGSTIWAEDHTTRIVWITLLALKDKFGEVNGTPVGLARIANVTVAECNAALAKFLSPEPSRHDDGRRIEEIEHGWLILNHAKYQRLASKEDSQERNAERQRRFRMRHDITVTKRNAPVTPHNASVTVNRDISDSDVDVDTDKKEKKDNNTASKTRSVDGRGTRLPEDWQPSEEDRAFAIDLGLDASHEAADFKDYWTSVPGPKARKLDWSKTFRNRCRMLSKGGQRGINRETFEQKRMREARAIIREYDK